MHREVLRLDFDRRLMLQFRGSTITSNAELLTYCEPDDAIRFLMLMRVPPAPA
jgi:hypothetical protein